MSKRITLKEIAQAAGVSTATVSYIINKTPSQTIPEATSEKVRKVIAEMGYVPNMAARSLSARKSHLIGVVIPQSEPGKQFMFSNPFYGEILSSIEFEARKSGYDIILSGTDVNERYFEIAQKRSLDGIIIVGLYPHDYYDGLEQSEIPVVLVDSYCEGLPFPEIRSDDVNGARNAVKMLIDNGHSKIAFITGPLRNQGVDKQRFLGYQQAFEDAGLKFDSSWIFQGDVTFESGKSFATMIAGGSDLTAAFITSDIVAIGFASQFKNLGKRIPDDFSIISFDDTYLARTSSPELTTVHQDIAKKGREAVRMILEQRNDLVTLDLDLVERDSVRKLE
ncbi:MAG: LacI family DNA-binding transcriptional regulator [Sphaerochaetaceae bacterium]|jgi:LacI family transcriptional regulator